MIYSFVTLHYLFDGLLTTVSSLNLFLMITGKCRSWKELFFMFLVHVNVIPNLKKRCKSLLGRYQRNTLVDVSINWATSRN